MQLLTKPFDGQKVPCDIPTNYLLQTRIPHQSVTQFSYGTNASSLTH